ncbi:MAG: ABC transporter ATP-binding protein [Candidatus Thermoplasmatota archaeon]|nr:ABC transporter ATP-binding protein [Candidatus Thermoplasmatota archaeon]MBS3789758.1 ABC transporter ATP-binding protein [Candidatus Thermoplasmatota archaeon]
MAEGLLEIKDLDVGYKTYRGVTSVLYNLNLKVNRNETIGVIGESGCGKTTTMKTINQILPDNAVIKSGEVNFKGKDILNMTEKELVKLRRRNVSMIPQDPTASLNPLFKVKTQMKDVLKYSRQNSEDLDFKEETIKLFNSVALSDPERVYDSYPFQLSGGMRQRVCIAMSLAAPKDLLIADEPTTNLDVTIQDQVLRLIGEILEEMNFSAILVSQALGLVKKFVDKIYVVYGGTVIEIADTEKIFENPIHPYTKGLIESTPKLTGGGFSSGIAGQTPDYIDPPSGCRFHPRCPHHSEDCKTEKPKMREFEKNHYVACWRQ